MNTIKAMNAQNNTKFITNWSKAYNIAEATKKAELYEVCSRLHDAYDAMFSEIYESLVDSYNICTIELSSEPEFEDFKEIVENVIEKHRENIDACEEETREFKKRAPEEIYLHFKSMSAPRTKQDRVMLTKRHNMTKKFILSYIKYFLEETIEPYKDNIQAYFNSLDETLEFLQEYNKNNQKEEADDITCNEVEQFEIRKIFDYKEMVALAKSKGYYRKSSTGSHTIYEHHSSNKTIVIPSHDLGLGLSIKIQKDIVRNVC